jgi:hypothetical protein
VLRIIIFLLEREKKGEQMSTQILQYSEKTKVKNDAEIKIRVPQWLKENLTNMAVADDRELSDFVRHNLKKLALPHSRATVAA